MTKVTIYKVQLYNVATDAPLISRRMATLKGAAIMGGVILEGTGIEIDASQLEPGEEWTPRGFTPNANASGLQPQINL
jgi:hypothetical protein